MSLAPTAFADHRAASPAAGGMSFASNNPFRRAVSPILPPTDSASTRPRMANNPFLDPPAKPMAASKPVSTNPFDQDIFKDVTAQDNPIPSDNPQLQMPRRVGTLPAGTHRPSRSDEKKHPRPRQQDPRGPSRTRQPPAGLDIFASPPRADGRRPRRNSESSVLDKEKMVDDDKRRRERRKEREARREKEGKSKDGKSAKSQRKPQGLDIIDQLDVTGIYGQGLFHHDGPFDACNPHRNRKKDYRAPMQAFPTGSANNTLGGSGPVNSKLDFDKFHGRGVEGFHDFATSGATGPDLRSLMPKKQETFNPIDRIEQLHGEESTGLGTSTFLDGAPAPKSALQRRESESEVPSLPGPGLGRKKSLAVRLRGLSQPRRNENAADRVLSPDPRYGPASPEVPGIAQSAGGLSRARNGQEKNPFFNEYDDAYERKGAQIRIAESANSGRARAPSSPRPVGLTRSITTESAGYGTGEPAEKPSGSGGGGFLNRMKSLKGGRRARPERRLS